MKEFIDKLIERMKEYKKQWMDADYLDGIDEIIEIINELAEEYKGKDCSKCSRRSWYQKGYSDAEKNNGWIPCSERLPSKEECGAYGSKEFQVTIPQSCRNKTISMHFAYETVRGKEVARWKWRGSISPWEVIAWKNLDAPYTEGE